MQPPKPPRCTQCRKRFEPHPATRGAQRVCGPVCRALRDNALARHRRALHLDAAHDSKPVRRTVGVYTHRPDGARPPRGARVARAVRTVRAVGLLIPRQRQIQR